MKRLIPLIAALLFAGATSTFAQSFDFSAYQRRLVVPVAGSIRAADGSRFKTSLRLTLPPKPSDTHVVSGLIVFHPQGLPMSDNDPSVPYSLTYAPLLAQTVYFDDVVGEMGLSGLGTLDIIPDQSSNGVVPLVEARIVNDKNGYINGDSVAVLKGSEAFPATIGRIYRFPVFDQARARVNVGVRTYGPEGVLLGIDISGYAGTVRHIQRYIEPNTFRHMSLYEFVGGQEVADGETITVLASAPDRNSNALIYYTITENSTNDPTVIVAPSYRDQTVNP
ncbi:MAG TPA: hypothetical protein VFN10_06915 [Thermoanaerobaculia bacterium]|nr:hypothetical protein [Thermoanaerobaculia bacterium]